MIYYIRHGETDFNKVGRVQGYLDIPLSKEGILQAQKARDDSENLEIDLIYCSTLLRARQTAEIINEKHGVKIVFDDRLKELNMGSIQGKTEKEFSDFEKENAFVSPEKLGGESLKELCVRVESVLKEIESLNKNVLIVAHGGVYKAVYRYINNIESFDVGHKTLKNATIIELKNHAN